MHCRKLDTSLTSPDTKEVIYQLLHNDCYVPDCMADIRSLTNAFGHVTEIVGVFNGSGKLGGCAFLSDIVPGHEGTLYSWFWKPCISADVVQYLRGYIEDNAGTYGLSRIVSRTADAGHGRILVMCGLTLEGRFKNAYKSGGRLMTLFQYRKLFSR